MSAFGVPPSSDVRLTFRYCYSRVTELEKKIDGLVNLFQTRQHPREMQGLDSTTTTLSDGDQNPMPCTTSPNMPGLDRSSATQATPGGASPDKTRNHNTPPEVDAGQTDKTFYLVPGFSLSVEKAEEYLDIYRTRMIPNFPFVPIPPGTTAAALHRKKRFLFWCITQAVVPQTAAVQQAVDEWVRRHAAMHVIVLKEKSTELLQGLLVYVAWGEVHRKIGIGANSLLQMAIGLVLDFTVLTLSGPLSWMPKTVQADAWALLQGQVDAAVVSDQGRAAATGDGDDGPVAAGPRIGSIVEQDQPVMVGGHLDGPGVLGGDDAGRPRTDTVRLLPAFAGPVHGTVHVIQVIERHLQSHSCC
ncbi:hypothetical protein CTA2_6298 [Colletotrichum tanaceti]|uniref:Uncharacterized protein n=1 Tax=Colletotrichum tanaceti TaxID=1306861 RepID=A0A4U6XCE4_9PEZI|nr:hypothetical protein CTA2_6298 [Colletotrichum tanaceti]TKW53411.1 hypothetical protein CTA1_11319 [Colletotrichum tanaceti]